MKLNAILLAATVFGIAAVSAMAAPQATDTPPGALLPNVLYGAAYYNEYMPADLQPGRLEKDVALMQQAGISVVRMGESTWSLWEPTDGKFETAWMDRVVGAMGKAAFSLTTHQLVSRFTIRLGPAAKTDDPTQALINISTHETAHDVPDHVDDSHDIMTPGQVGGADLYHRASRTRRRRS